MNYFGEFFEWNTKTNPIWIRWEEFVTRTRRFSFESHSKESISQRRLWLQWPNHMKCYLMSNWIWKMQTIAAWRYVYHFCCGISYKMCEIIITLDKKLNKQLMSIYMAVKILTRSIFGHYQSTTLLILLWFIFVHTTELGELDEMPR